MKKTECKKGQYAPICQTLVFSYTIYRKEKLMPAVLRELYKRSAMRLQESKNDFDFSIKKFDAMIVVFFLV